MPEDGVAANTGFLFFKDDQQPAIANEAAVRNASVHLVKESFKGAALEHHARATEAVQSAARKKSLRDALDDEPDAPNIVDGDGYFL